MASNSGQARNGTRPSGPVVGWHAWVVVAAGPFRPPFPAIGVDRPGQARGGKTRADHRPAPLAEGPTNLALDRAAGHLIVDPIRQRLPPSKRPASRPRAPLTVLPKARLDAGRRIQARLPPGRRRGRPTTTVRRRPKTTPCDQSELGAGAGSGRRNVALFFGGPRPAPTLLDGRPAARPIALRRPAPEREPRFTGGDEAQTPAFGGRRPPTTLHRPGGNGPGVTVLAGGDRTDAR